MKLVQKSSHTQFLKDVLASVVGGVITVLLSVPTLLELIRKIRPTLFLYEIADGLLVVLAQLSFFILLIMNSLKSNRTNTYKKRGRLVILGACNFLLLIVSWMIIGPLISEFFIAKDELPDLISKHQWILYDPNHYDPDRNPNPDIDSMRKELGCIKDAGFDGIITMSSRGTLSFIPELAKKKGHMVIMGIWDPRDEKEVAIAISKKEFVDAYCIGHNGLGPTISRWRPHKKDPGSTMENLPSSINDRTIETISQRREPPKHR